MRLMSAIPGWYSDPGGSPDLRYWDGQRWSPTTSPRPRAAAGPAQDVVAVATLEPVGYAPSPATGYSTQRLAYPPVMGSPLRRRRLPKLLITLGVLIAVICVAAVVLEVQDRTATQNAVEHTTIQLPERAAGLQKITGSLASQLQSLDASEADLAFVTHLTGGYQLPNGKPRAIVVVGKLAVESREFSRGLTSAETGAHRAETNMGIPLTTFSKVDAGPLGGDMVCGTIQYPSVSGTECIFVDRATIGSVTMLDTDGSDDHSLALLLRSAVETRI